jgi:hypothetical protein
VPPNEDVSRFAGSYRSTRRNETTLEKLKELFSPAGYISSSSPWSGSPSSGRYTIGTCWDFGSDGTMHARSRFTWLGIALLLFLPP